MSHLWLSTVLLQVNVRDILNCRLVCKEWNGICMEEELWDHKFIELFGSRDIIDLKLMLKSSIVPNVIEWFGCCHKLNDLVQQKRLRQIMNQEDKDNNIAAIAVLLHLAICRAFIGFPDKDTTEIFSTPETYIFGYKQHEIISFVIRYNLSPIALSKRQLKATNMGRKLSDPEIIIALSTILKGKLRAQLFVLRELFEHICGPINSKKVTIEFILKYDTIFTTFQKKKDENNNDLCWIILRSQIRFVVKDKETLLNAVINILREHKTNGIRENPFRQKFERSTGLPFGTCSKKPLKKYIKARPDLFHYSGPKIFLIK